MSPLLGLSPDDAQMRLKESGISFTLKLVEPKRPVGLPCQPRVMRVREKTLPDGSPSIELLIGNFKLLEL